MQSGFWTPETLASTPLAAACGYVLDKKGKGILNAKVTVELPKAAGLRGTLSDITGQYSITDLQPNETYAFSAFAKGYIFKSNPQTLVIYGNTQNINFIEQTQK